MSENKDLKKAEKRLSSVRGVFIGLKSEKEKRIEFLDSVIALLTQERDELKASLPELEDAISDLKGY